MKRSELTVSSEEGHVQLLDFLSLRLGCSKKKAKSLLNTRGVLVNQKRVWMAKHALIPGDKVSIQQASEISGQRVHVNVLYEDDTLLIVNKPAGLLANGDESMESHARKRLHESGLRACHRLDRDTSGCLLMARDQDSFREVCRLFKERKMNKTYHAIVSGRLVPPVQRINTPVRGRPAVTQVKTLSANKNASHLQVSIHTGRTHQIRSHLSGIGHPVIGDRYYGTKKTLSEREKMTRRQMLHASGLDFVHPLKGRRVRCKAPLPHDFRRCLQSFNLT